MCRKCLSTGSYGRGRGGGREGGQEGKSVCLRLGGWGGPRHLTRNLSTAIDGVLVVVN